MLKSGVIFILLGALSGCASQQGTAFDRQLLLELEEKNTRLEAEVVRLREQNLRKGRKVCADSPPPAEESVENATPADLPVVKVSPEDDEEHILEEPSGPVVSVRPAADEPEEDTHPGTRPVLKVRGQHEAWVYHRPLTAEDKQAKTLPPSAPSPNKSSSKDSPSPQGNPKK